MQPAVHPRRRRVALVMSSLLALLILLGAVGRAAIIAATAHDRATGPNSAWTPTRLTRQTNALLTDPRHPDVALAGTDSGVWRSSDGGLHWQSYGGGLRGQEVLSLAAAPGGAVLFAGTQTGVVYALDLAGIAGRWKPISPALNSNSSIFSLAVSSGRRAIVLAGTGGAIYRGSLSKHAWHWQRVATTGYAAISSIAWTPAGSSSALAAVFGVAPPVLATSDDGQSWHAATAGLPSELPTQALLVTTARGPRVVLSTMGGGVWERTAAGPWRDISAGLPGRHAMPLAILTTAGTPILYAGTMGYGVYIRRGAATWQPFGRGLTGVNNTILALAVVLKPHSHDAVVLAGTIYGVARHIA